MYEKQSDKLSFIFKLDWQQYHSSADRESICNRNESSGGQQCISVLNWKMIWISVHRQEDLRSIVTLVMATTKCFVIVGVHNTLESGGRIPHRFKKQKKSCFHLHALFVDFWRNCFREEKHRGLQSDWFGDR